MKNYILGWSFLGEDYKKILTIDSFQCKASKCVSVVRFLALCEQQRRTHVSSFLTLRMYEDVCSLFSERMSKERPSKEV